ncbi:homeobox protein 2-like [Mytilus californianus]|uniref:homeobox protein 2-like n=1 Tax=Mytilus californianus TaxID=6549 RepID=UPI002245BD3C|nr:homeobox protein 2-like [Mytilus californianus]
MVTYAVFVFLITLSITSASKQCYANQKLRMNKDGVQICCSTVKCGESKTFKYCTNDGGSDKCVDCPPGTFTRDKFDTKLFPLYNPEKWQKELRICASLPSCDAEENLLVGTKCRCNLDKGYFGEDANNCILDRRNCKNRGVQLTIQGLCVPCPADTFKTEDGDYKQCRNKTRCQANEEETYPGSSTTDRRCKKKEITQTTTVGPPVMNITSVTDKSRDEKSTPVEAWLVPVLIVIFMILGVFGGYIYRQRILEFCRNVKKDRHEEAEIHELESLTATPGNGSYVVLHTDSKVDYNGNPNAPHGHHYENGGEINRNLNNTGGFGGSASQNGFSGNRKTNLKVDVESPNNPREHTDPKLVVESPNNPREQTDLKVVDEIPNIQDRKKDKSNGIPTTVQGATSIPLRGQDGYVSLGDSLYDNDPTSSGYSGNQVDTSESIKSQERRLLSNNSIEEFTPTSSGNIPTPSLLGSLETTHDSTNSKEAYSTGEGVGPKSDTGEDHIKNNKRSPILNLSDKKNEACTDRPVGKVSPTIRPDPQNQQSPNASQNDDQVQPLNTTVGGIDIGTASNNDSYKFVPSHANRLEFSSENGENLAAADTQELNEPMNDRTQESSSQDRIQSVSQPQSSNRIRTSEPEGNGTNLSENGTSHTFRTHSGREVCTPESANNSHESSIEQNTRDDNSHQSEEASSMDNF